jgi:CRISPR-associated protein Csb3
MASASIPVDLFNPGEVLASLGFLEAADVLLGDAEGGFEWSDASTCFALSARGDENPFEVVLRFLAEAKIVEWLPTNYVEGGAADGESEDADESNGDEEGVTAGDEDLDESEDDEGYSTTTGRERRSTFTAREGDRNSLPIRMLGTNGRELVVSHWADGSSRNDFKLYSGNRSAHRIAGQMLRGSRKKPGKKQTIGDLKTRGVQQLWQERPDELIRAPFDVLTPMGGSFNFDPRGAWTAIDAGYSPNTQKDGIDASPVVEILAAIGLEHARPDEYETRKVRYFVWGQPLPPTLARAALAGANLKILRRGFEFELDLSGKNKVITFAREETDR